MPDHKVKIKYKITNRNLQHLVSLYSRQLMNHIIFVNHIISNVNNNVQCNM